MFTQLALLSALAAAAAAQSVSGASEACNAQLTKLNSDSTLTTCTTGLLAAGSSFNATTADAASAESSLNTFCSTTVSCSEDSVRTALSALYGACGPELAGGANKDVTVIYETVYSLLPYKAALCSKGDDGKFCAVSGPASTTVPTTDGSSLSAQQVLQNLGTTAPNSDTFAKTNLLFLFRNPSSTAEELCNSCTRTILTSWLDFEARNDFGPGFSGAIMLAGQKPLYTAVLEKCGSTFLEGSLQAAGSLSGGITGSSNAASPASTVAGNVAGVAALLSAIAVAAF